MPKELNPDNARQAYCETIACTGVGAAQTDCN